MPRKPKSRSICDDEAEEWFKANPGFQVQVVATVDSFVSAGELKFIARSGEVLILSMYDRGCSCCGSSYEREWELRAP